MPAFRPLGDHGALFTDLYELTMAASYFAAGLRERATFSFSIRRYPPGRGYFVAAGLADVIEYLENFRFSAESLDYLQRTGLFSENFLDHLRALRFTGDVDAMPEGTLCFADEPLLEITAPIIEAQLVETYVINQLHLQTMLATKSARCVHAAAGRPVIDFSLRRTHGVDAGMKIARCSYLAGAAGTSNVLAGMVWGIPTFGTMAHSFVQSFESERDAFLAFARAFPTNSTFLVDTYDTIRGVRIAVAVAIEMRRAGNSLRAIRLDSGDLAALSREARRILDEAGLREVRIFASGGLDEYEIEKLVQSGAPIDAFGVGTEMGTSGDAPWLDCAYKLVEYAGRGRIKLSSGKATWVGRKQVWRSTSGQRLVADCIALRDESPADVQAAIGVEAETLEPLLQPVMRGGQRVVPAPSLESIRGRFLDQFGCLDSRFKDLRHPPEFPVHISPALRGAQERAAAEARARADIALGTSRSNQP